MPQVSGLDIHVDCDIQKSTTCRRLI